MASAAAAIDQAASPKPVDASLWWDSFETLFDELDSAPLDSDISGPLLEKVKSARGWLIDPVASFKPPNEGSKRALDSSKIAVGTHQLDIDAGVRKLALRASSCLCLDEVQSYILVTRCSDLCKLSLDNEGQDILHLFLLRYYVERQCLFKCIRRIFVHSLNLDNGSCTTEEIRCEALQLLKDDLQKNLLSALQNLLLSATSEKKEIDFTFLWVEESLIEVNLALDVIFLLYYENFCRCDIEKWKAMYSIFKEVLSGSYNHGKLAVSTDASKFFGHAKAQLLLILIETLDLENLLRLVHDEMPFSQGSSPFSFSDMQEMDALISSLLVSKAYESGPLVLAWAVFLCLLLSLPGSKNEDLITEIDHISYVRHAFEAAPFKYILEVLQSAAFRESDGPVSAFLSILRTFIAAFTASYELTNELEGMILNLIIDILCEIYSGEESLSVQFWDKESFIDGPVRSLLYMLENEFPYRSTEFIRLLSALCEGAWPAECTYNFLDKLSGIASLFEISNHAYSLNPNDIVEAYHSLPIPGVESLKIPSGTKGYVLKIVDNNFALVRWECAQSGITILLLQMAQDLEYQKYEELFLILQLFYRMLSANMDLSFALMYVDVHLPADGVQAGGALVHNVRVDVVSLICTLLINLLQEANSRYIVSSCVNILVLMLKSAPQHVLEVASRTDIFATESSGLSSDSWVLSGGLARMLLAKQRQVLDFTMQLVESGVENKMVSALIVYSIQYVLVTHLNWRCKCTSARWKVTLKVLEVIKSCIYASHFSRYMYCIVWSILLNDSSVHNILSRLLLVSAQTLEKLELSSHYTLKDIEDLQVALCSTLEIVCSMLEHFSKESFSSPPIFMLMVLSPTNRPTPVSIAAVSCFSSQNSAIQIASARVLSLICFIVATESETSEDIGIIADSMQIGKLRSSVSRILSEDPDRNEDLWIAVLDLLSSAAEFQPAFLVSILYPEDEVDMQQCSTNGTSKSSSAAASANSTSIPKSNLLEAILKLLKKSETLMTSAPGLLLSVVNLLKALWERTVEYAQILESIRSSTNFWENLMKIVSVDVERGPGHGPSNYAFGHGSYRYRCQAAVLEIIAHDLFLQEKVLAADLPDRQTLSKGQPEIKSANQLSKPSKIHKDNFATLWENSIMENLIISSSSSGCAKNVILLSKIAVCLCVVGLIAKCSNIYQHLSIFLVKKISAIAKKLTEHPAFTTLIAEYSSRGYSGGNHLSNLIINDLYYHLQGEMEGREIIAGPFKELSQFLLELAIIETSESRYEVQRGLPDRRVHIYDIEHLKKNFQLGLWNASELKVCKHVAERMFSQMHEANSILSIVESKHFVLKALLGIIIQYEENVTRNFATHPSKRISQPLVESIVKHLCKCLRDTEDILFPSVGHQSLVMHFADQAELLLHFSRILYRQQPDRECLLPVSVLLIKTCNTGLRCVAYVRPSDVLDRATKALLMVLSVSVHFGQLKSFTQNTFDEASVACLGLLPVLCSYAEIKEYSDLSLASLDLILKGFLASKTWMPVLQKYLRLQLLVHRIQQTDALASVIVKFNFFLTLSSNKDGALWLYSVNLFHYIKVLFNDIWKEDGLLEDPNRTCVPTVANADAIWRLGLAVIASMMHSLGDDSACTDIVDGAISYFLYEKAWMISCILSSLHFPTDEYSKKRAKTRLTQISLRSLKDIEQTLMLICVLVKHQSSWCKGMKEMDSQLREMCIRLLAFVSKGVLRILDTSTRTIPFCFSPVCKEELPLLERPSFINSKHGWFAVSALISLDESKAFGPNPDLSLVTAEKLNSSTDVSCSSRFSDIIAIEIYKIAYLLLKFLCMQAKAAAKRVEEVEFLDLAHFPELPMPEILHGLQDQTISIITELCGCKSSNSIGTEAEGLCHLLVQILEKSLYLELCVSKLCGIRLVMGRLEEFSDEVKQLITVLEQQSILRSPLRSLKRIIALCYPGLLEGSLI